MPDAARLLALIAFGLAASGCGERPAAEPADNSAVTDVEALPPDESAATPTDELRNGAAEPTDNGPPQG